MPQWQPQQTQAAEWAECTDQCTIHNAQCTIIVKMYVVRFARLIYAMVLCLDKLTIKLQRAFQKGILSVFVSIDVGAGSSRPSGCKRTNQCTIHNAQCTIIVKLYVVRFARLIYAMVLCFDKLTIKLQRAFRKGILSVFVSVNVGATCGRPSRCKYITHITQPS
jgi:hypothetical protein